MAKQKGNTVQIAAKLIGPVLDELGLVLWDVRFEKEGSQWCLRYFIEGEDGSLTIQDCEQASRAVDKLLDEADPIEQSYILEVGSPGVERELKKEEHFRRYVGHMVHVRLIRPVEGERDFVGELVGREDKTVTVRLRDSDIEMAFELGEAAFVRLYVDFDDGGHRE